MQSKGQIFIQNITPFLVGFYFLASSACARLLDSKDDA